MGDKTFQETRVSYKNVLGNEVEKNPLKNEERTVVRPSLRLEEGDEQRIFKKITKQF
jgi:hypothetical protein